jgi:hypothetical protein
MQTFMSVSEAEAARGKIVLVVFAPDVDHEPIEGRLFNIDPATGTVILVHEEDAKPAFTVLYYDAIESVKGKHPMPWQWQYIGLLHGQVRIQRAYNSV